MNRTSKQERVYAPLDTQGLRLYKVVVSRQDGHSAGFELVMATSPRQAARFVERGYGPNGVSYTFIGYAQNVLQPKEWTE